MTKAIPDFRPLLCCISPRFKHLHSSTKTFPFLPINPFFYPSFFSSLSLTSAVTDSLPFSFFLTSLPQFFSSHQHPPKSSNFQSFAQFYVSLSLNLRFVLFKQKFSETYWLPCERKFQLQSILQQLSTTISNTPNLHLNFLIVTCSLQNIPAVWKDTKRRTFCSTSLPRVKKSVDKLQKLLEKLLDYLCQTFHSTANWAQVLIIESNIWLA